MIQELFNEQNEELIEELIEDLPNGWERFDDVALLPLNAFSNSRWNLVSREICGAQNPLPPQIPTVHQAPVGVASGLMVMHFKWDSTTFNTICIYFAVYTASIILIRL